MKTLGTVNGYSVSPARFGRKAFSFDGTTRGLTLAALAAGAKAGDTVEASFGGGMTRYAIDATPWDTRAGGHWATRTN